MENKDTMLVHSLYALIWALKVILSKEENNDKKASIILLEVIHRFGNYIKENNILKEDTYIMLMEYYQDVIKKNELVITCECHTDNN